MSAPGDGAREKPAGPAHVRRLLHRIALRYPLELPLICRARCRCGLLLQVPASWTALIFVGCGACAGRMISEDPLEIVGDGPR